MKNILLSFLLFSFMVSYAQVGINTEEPQATLEIKKVPGNARQGLLLPALTQAEIDAMQNPINGLIVYNTTIPCIYIYKVRSGAARGNWECIEPSEQTLFISYEGSEGAWVKGLTTNDDNKVKFMIKNNLDISLQGLNLDNAITSIGAVSSYNIEPVSSYNNVTISSKSSKLFTYRIKNFTPSSSGDMSVIFTALGKETIGNILVQEPAYIKAIQIKFEGQYIANKVFTTANKVILKVENFTGTAKSGVDMSNAINLSGVSGVSVKSGQNTSVNFPATGAITLGYELEGTPKEVGNLTATYVPNIDVSGVVNTSQQIAEPPTGSILVKSVSIEGEYIANVAISSTNFVNVTLQNKNSYPLSGFDLSNALSLSGAGKDGVTISPDQNKDVSLNANETKTIKYTLKGTPSAGEFTATWKHSIFGTASDKTTVKEQLWVSPPIVSTGEAQGDQTTEVQIDAGAGNTWKVKDMPSDWVEFIGATTGTGNSVLRFKMKEHTTSKPKITEFTIERSDGALGKVIVNKPATNEIMVGTIAPFSINGETKQITITGDTQVTNYTLITKPDWVESFSVNQPSGKLIINTTSRTTAGPDTAESLAFYYGPGNSYVFNKLIPIKQKAQLCSDTDKWINPKFNQRIRSKYRRIGPQDQIILEERAGFDDFNDVMNLSQHDVYGHDYNVQNTAGKSLLLAQINKQGNTYLVAGNGSNKWEAFVSVPFRHQKNIDNDTYFGYQTSAWNLSVFISKYIDGKELFIRVYEYNGLPSDKNQYRSGRIQDYNIDTVPTDIIRACICVDGYDENTPDAP